MKFLEKLHAGGSIDMPRKALRRWWNTWWCFLLFYIALLILFWVLGMVVKPVIFGGL